MSSTNHINEVIDISDWSPDDAYDGIFSKGAREKSVYFSPVASTTPAIKPDWRYLYKKSSLRYPHQFWIEILAYQLSTLFPEQLTVPPAYPAHTNDTNEDQPYGALIEWFYGPEATYVDGGIFIENLIPNFDRKRGTQHNLLTIIDKFPWFIPPEEAGKLSEKRKPELIQYWTRQLTFDTLIGNTDRHQDNWGLIIKTNPPNFLFSPVFDNGTSMSHEILETNFYKFKHPNDAIRYLTKTKCAKHHMKWSLNDTHPINFFDFMKKFVSTYPETEDIVRSLLNFTEKQVREVWHPLVRLVKDPKYTLTQARLDFTLKMLMLRRELLEKRLNEPD